MAEKKKVPAIVAPAAGDKKKALETAIAKIEKDYGKGTIMRLGDDISVNVEALSTGSLSLDLALGIGGVPRGRIDYFVVSDDIKNKIKESSIRSDIMGSDHCPVCLEIEL